MNTQQPQILRYTLKAAWSCHVGGSNRSCLTLEFILLFLSLTPPEVQTLLLQSQLMFLYMKLWPLLVGVLALCLLFIITNHCLMIALLLTMYWERSSALVINAMFTFSYLECVLFIFWETYRVLKSHVISECMQMHGTIKWTRLTCKLKFDWDSTVAFAEM